MNRESELHNVMMTFADLIAERVAARLEPGGASPAERMKEKSAVEPIEPKRRLIPLTKWNEYHDGPKVGGLRALVFHADTNGFDKVIRRIGRRVLIDEEAFFLWVDEQNGAAKTIRAAKKCPNEPVF